MHQLIMADNDETKPHILLHIIATFEPSLVALTVFLHVALLHFYTSSEWDDISLLMTYVLKIEDRLDLWGEWAAISIQKHQK